MTLSYCISVLALSMEYKFVANFYCISASYYSFLPVLYDSVVFFLRIYDVDEVIAQVYTYSIRVRLKLEGSGISLEHALCRRGFYSRAACIP